MGNGRFSSTDWDTYTKHNTAGQSRAQVFSTSSLLDRFNPAMIGVRESRDSAANPESTAIWLGCDVTGSMGMIAEQLIRTDMPKIAEQIYNRKPVSDPHIGVMAIGDAYTDRAPLQVTELEASIVLADQMKELWLEGNGGGNGGESYMLAHLFAAWKTSVDCLEKRGRKGFVFTVGDEPIHDVTRASDMGRIFGDQYAREMTKREAVDLASVSYDVFHVVLINEGHCRGGGYGRQEVLDSWEEVLPQRVIKLEDVSKLSETIVSVLQLVNGERKDDIAKSWGGSTSVVVANALRDIQVRAARGGAARLA